MLRPILLAAVLAVSSIGCVTREDIRGIQTDLYNIQQGMDKRFGSVKDQTDNVQTSQAELSEQIRTLSASLAALQTELQDSRQRNSALASRLDDLEAALIQRMDAQIELLSGSKFVEKPSPGTLFNLANSDFSRGRYTEAQKGFQNYLTQYPRGEKVREAKLRIGDSLAKLDQTAAAMQAYDELATAHPSDPLAATALFKRASLLEAAGKKAAAKEVYATIIRLHAQRPEAKAAQERLRGLQ